MKKTTMIVLVALLVVLILPVQAFASSYHATLTTEGVVWVTATAESESHIGMIDMIDVLLITYWGTTVKDSDYEVETNSTFVDTATGCLWRGDINHWSKHQFVNDGVGTIYYRTAG